MAALFGVNCGPFGGRGAGRELVREGGRGPARGTGRTSGGPEAEVSELLGRVRYQRRATVDGPARAAWSSFWIASRSHL